METRKFGTIDGSVEVGKCDYCGDIYPIGDSYFTWIEDKKTRYGVMPMFACNECADGLLNKHKENENGI